MRFTPVCAALLLLLSLSVAFSGPALADIPPGAEGGAEGGGADSGKGGSGGSAGTGTQTSSTGSSSSCAVARPGQESALAFAMLATGAAVLAWPRRRGR
jgi:hypothetical protein